MASSVISNTPYGIISDAMHDAGYLQEGDEPNSEQLASYMRRLNDIINLWQTQGLKLWLEQDLAIPLVEGQNKYTLGPAVGSSVQMSKPLRALQGYVLNSTTNIRRPIIPMAWESWMRLSQIVGNNGTISSYFIDKQAAVLNVWFWNTPDALEATNIAHLLIQQQAVNPINLEQNVSFPQEWRIALRWGLADDISSGQPQAIMDRCMQRATQFRQALENWDVEDPSTRFAIDPRMSSTNNNSFI